MSRSSARWEYIGLAALAAIVLMIPVYVMRQLGETPPPLTKAPPTFVGRDECKSCHEPEFNSWLNSDHDKAMDVAADSTVLGDFDDAVFTSKGVTSRFFRRDGKFFVHTAGPGGEMAEFEIAYTFGWEPLQQYLVEFPDGRVQCLPLSWDTEKKRWFHLYPDEPIPHDDELHWTGPLQNWNYMCAECHSTGLNKNYDAESRSYATTWSEINVSCEACHGNAEIFLTADKVAESELTANQGVIIKEIPNHHIAPFFPIINIANAGNKKNKFNDIKLPAGTWKLIASNSKVDHVNGVEGKWSVINSDGKKTFSLKMDSESLKIWVRD